MGEEKKKQLGRTSDAPPPIRNVFKFMYVLFSREINITQLHHGKPLNFTSLPWIRP